MPVESAWHELSLLLESAEGSLFLAEEYLVVRNKAGRLQPLQANKAQRLFEDRRGRENIVLKARQIGMSTWIAGRFLLKTILLPGTTSLMVAHTRESAESLFGVVMRMWENLPAPLRTYAGRPGRSNVGQITFPRMASEFRIASASDRNAGRGLSVQNLHCSEVARWDGDAAETLAGLRAALVPGGELVLESTPNGAYGCFHAEWQAADESGMVRHFAPWWFEPSYVGAAAANYTEEEMLLATRAELSAEQVGFRRELARRFGAMRSQEFAEDPVTCFRASGSCFFDLEVLEERMGVLVPPCTSRMGRALQIWLPPVIGRTYIVAADAAGGGSTGDFAAVQVIDEATGMQCAELQARLSPRDLARVAAELAREYNRALLVIERNNHGAAVLAFLEGDNDDSNLYTGHDRMPGWLTDAGSRPRMLGAFAKVLCRTPELIASERLLLECRSFAVDEHGRAAAARGSHDDLVMSMAIAQAVRSRH